LSFGKGCVWIKIRSGEEFSDERRKRRRADPKTENNLTVIE